MEDVADYLKYSPAVTVTQTTGNPANLHDIQLKIEALPDELRDILFDVRTAETVQSWEQAGYVPSQFSPAIAKITALILLGQVNLPQTSQLLVRLGMDSSSAQRTSEVLRNFLAPTLQFKAGYEEPADLGETEIPTLEKPRGATEPQGSNIIDLRKPQL
jgi:hypothetical protein